MRKNEWMIEDFIRRLTVSSDSGISDSLISRLDKQLTMAESPSSAPCLSSAALIHI